MAKALIVLILIAAAGYFIYQQIGRTPSEEEMLVTHMRDRFEALVNKFTSAAGRAGLIGGDATSDVDTTVTGILNLRTELAELRAKLTDEKALRRADALAEKIENFCRKNEIKRP